MTQPDSVICTLFEGNYHYGVAALVNSVYHNGYRGDIFAGYKGTLPFWAINTDSSLSEIWKGATTIHPANGLRIHFLPVETDWHLNNYKPDFMLSLKAKFPELVRNLFYFDPDIIIKYEWLFFEKWVGYGVTLVHELVAVALPPTHPVRREWEEMLVRSKRTVHRDLYSGINGGFCGVNKNDFDFLQTWSDIIHESIKCYNLNPREFKQPHQKYIFQFADQDALNITAMCYNYAISEMGPDAMDFVQTGWRAMSHATGSPKPWNKNFFLSCIRGFPPRLAEKAYWANTSGPIKMHSYAYIKFKQFWILCTAFIGRFYSRY